ncbi:hypothetical protein QJ850_gp034 [Acanthamoeba polyphaga mimivirus]|uniref:Uncharacterized protein n=1 Tax=Acanthamoeba polyphaga mimivirus Kroon TaxID=3069720 RepID=A0A0G2Y211_9VIRU|nr:hypothetical protein QJ850_gp034 [Acanthamoeba polyphaga mimivirus]AKI79763.1 hypothetical protein [Acanthamoeba polyphaga mimivirus Kroon]
MPSKIRKDNDNINKKHDNFFSNSYKECGVCTDKKRIFKKMFELTRIINALKIFLSKLQGRNLGTEMSIKIQKIKECVNILEAQAAEIMNRI